VKTQLSIQPASFDSPGRFSGAPGDGRDRAEKSLQRNGFLDATVTNEIEQDTAEEK